MQQIWEENGKVAPVTKIVCNENEVVNHKEEDKHGYKSIILSDGVKVKEFPFIEDENYSKGKKITVSIFKEKDVLKVTGVSKGKGFQGVVKRHGFKGGFATHGHRHDLRQAGSIGSAFPQHVMKGKKMAGRMGGDKVTIKNLEIIKILEDEKAILVKGAVPGRKGSFVYLKKVA